MSLHNFFKESLEIILYILKKFTSCESLIIIFNEKSFNKFNYINNVKETYQDHSIQIVSL